MITVTEMCDLLKTNYTSSEIVELLCTSSDTVVDMLESEIEKQYQDILDRLVEDGVVQDDSDLEVQ